MELGFWLGAANPFPDPFTVPYLELNEKIRTWFFNLHTHVNQTYKSEEPISEPLFDASLFIEEIADVTPTTSDDIVTIDCLQELYGITDLRSAYYNAKMLISKFFNTALVSIIKWHVFESAVIRLLTVFGA
jgi:hypothetical protein